MYATPKACSLVEPVCSSEFFDIRNSTALLGASICYLSSIWRATGLPSLTTNIPVTIVTIDYIKTYRHRAIIILVPYPQQMLWETSVHYLTDIAYIHQRSFKGSNQIKDFPNQQNYNLFYLELPILRRKPWTSDLLHFSLK